MARTTIFTESLKSYATVDFAADYFADERGNNNWTTVDGSDGGLSLLIQATFLLDELLWKGTPVSEDQNFAFPRSNLLSRQGGSIPTTVGANTVIPTELSEATCELALWLGQANRYSEDYALAGELQGVGTLSGYNRLAKQKIPGFVKSKVNFLLVNRGNSISRV